MSTMTEEQFLLFLQVVVSALAVAFLTVFIPRIVDFVVLAVELGVR